MLATVLASATVLAAVGCGDSSTTAPRPLEGVFFASEPRPLTGPACASEARIEPVERTLSVRLLAGPGITADRLARHTRAAQDYLAHYGITLTPATATAARVEHRAAIAGSRRDVDRALAEAGLPASQATPRARAVAATAVAGPLRQLVREHATPSGDEVVVVLLERIVTPDSPLASRLPRAAGLTLSPQLSPHTDPGGELSAALGLEDHTPLVLLSAVELDRLEPDRRDTTLAHELGHALGLPHHRSHDNLMAIARRRGCRPVLTPSQTAQLGSARVSK